jgi:hypothetical protein
MGSTRRCQASPVISPGLRDGESEKPQTSVRVSLYKGAGGRGPLPTDVADAPDQSVLFRGIPEAVLNQSRLRSNQHSPHISQPNS